MSSLLETLQHARATGDWNALAQQIPYLRFLCMSAEVRDGQLLGVMRPGDHLVGNSSINALHGGSLGALLEASAQLELFYRQETIVLPKTITITVDYLRSAKQQETFVRSTILKQGKRVVTSQAVAWQEDEKTPVAVAKVISLVIGD